MVKSVLNSKITYLEDKNISVEDVDKDGQLYEYQIMDDIVVNLATGNFRYDHVAENNVLFFPIYLVKDGEKIVSQIGVFEFMNADLPNVLDADSDVDLNALGEPLLYSFATNEFLSKYAVSTPDVAVEPEPIEDTDEYVIPAQQDVEEQLFDTPLDVFEEDEEPDITFKIDESSTWIQKLMRSNKYGIVDNEGAGDCLFACIRDAYAGIGKVLSIPKLREMVSNSATQELFNNYKTLFDNFTKTVDELTVIRDKIKEDAKAKSLIGKAEKERIKKKAIIGEIEQMKEHLTKIVDQLATAKINAAEFKFMKGVDDLAAFKKKIRTCNFWGDVWAIHTLERVLNIKLIVLSSEKYNKDDLQNILQCGHLEDNVTKFEPDYYVIVDYTGSHYRLITYGGKTIFKFADLPKSIKHKIIDMCMVKNVGYFTIIPDFQKLKEERKGMQIK